MSNDTKPSKKDRKRAEELRGRLTQLADEQQSRLAEMDAVQSELAELGVDDGDTESAGADATDDTAMSELAELRRTIEEADERYRRVLADFQNFQRRSVENERRARDAGKAGVLEQMVAVLDTFDLALRMDPATTTPGVMLDGVTMIRGEMLRLLAGLGFGVVEPITNTEFDPHRHEAVSHADADDVEPGHIVELVQPGYALHDRVLRPAKVTVKPGDACEADPSTDDGAAFDRSADPEESENRSRSEDDR